MYLVVGLGNPGQQYEETRHNLGFMVIDDLARVLGDLRLRETARQSVFGSTYWEGERVVLAKPMTYMNHSGFAVAELLKRFDVGPDDLLVVCDDMALPPGYLRIRGQGSSGGHKGIQSIIDSIGTNEFARLRVGIGEAPRDNIDHVLSRFRKSERDDINESINQAVDAVFVYMKDGLEEAMQQFNRKVKPSDESE